LTQINIKEVLKHGLRCYASAPFLSAVHTLLTLLIFGLLISIGSGIIFIFIFHLPFAVYAGFYTASRTYFSGEKITFKSYWEGYALRKNVKRFSGRIILFFILLLALMVAAILGAFDEVPDLLLKGPLQVTVFLAGMAAGTLYQIALPNAIFSEGISGKEAFARSRENMFQQLGPASLLFFILFLTNMLGAAFFGIGLLFTVPFSAYCRQYLWETQAGALRHQDIEAKIEQIGVWEDGSPSPQTTD
jgi:hypothetical protein